MVNATLTKVTGKCQPITSPKMVQLSLCLTGQVRYAAV